MSSPTPAPSSARTAGAVVLCAGLTLLICRYVYLPIDGLSAGLNTLLTGGAIGLIIASGQLMRRADGPVRWLAALPLAAGLSALIVAGFMHFVGDPDAPELESVEVPGLVISVPRWPEVNQHRLGPRGQIVRSRFDERAQVHIEWKLGPTLSRDEIAQMLSGLLPNLKAHDGPPERVADRPAETVVISDDARPFASAMTTFQCGEDGLTVLVGTSMQATEAVALRLHGAVLASARCAALPPGLVVPSAHFEAPPGFVEVEDPEMKMYARGDEAVGFAPAEPDLELPRKLAEVEQARNALMGLMLQNLHPIAPPGLRKVGGQPRQYFAFTGTVADEPGSQRALLTAFGCPKLGASFVGFYFGPADADLDAAARLLDGARCPD
ncbi:MAG: hypothetical protein KC620_02995 [Myxococcales bacterium]|nr:hypothetical protein [Myxococcales bacterium]